jgi:hypothetical protein
MLKFLFKPSDVLNKAKENLQVQFLNAIDPPKPIPNPPRGLVASSGVFFQPRPEPPQFWRIIDAFTEVENRIAEREPFNWDSWAIPRW